VVWQLSSVVVVWSSKDQLEMLSFADDGTPRRRLTAARRTIGESSGLAATLRLEPHNVGEACTESTSSGRRNGVRTRGSVVDMSHCFRHSCTIRSHPTSVPPRHLRNPADHQRVSEKYTWNTQNTRIKMT